MGKIADLFFEGHLDDGRLQIDAKRSGDKAGQTLGQSLSASIKKSWSGGELGKGLVQGLGLAGGLGAANALAGGIRKVTDFIGGSIAAASDLNETISKSAVIFGESTGEIEQWAGTAAKAFGQSKRQALDTASGFAGLFNTVGIELDKSAGMATKLTELGSDLASFFNTDVQTAIDAIRSGLSGESEPLRRFNVFLSETAVSAKLAQMGIKRVKGAFTESQKATARYALILEQTATAQGDFARTADGLANSQRARDAQLENMSAALGQKFLPIQLAVTQAQIDFLEGLGLVGDALGAVGDAADSALSFITPWDGTLTETEKTALAYAKALEEAAARQTELGEHTDEVNTHLEDIRAGLDLTVDKIEEHNTAWSNAPRAIGTSMAAMVDEIDSGRSDVESALDNLLEEIEAGMDPIEERARLLRISRQIRDEIADGTPAVSAKAQDLQRAVTARLLQLQKETYAYGQNTVSAYAGGLASQIPHVTSVVKKIAGITKQYLKVESPAEKGPLSEGGGTGQWGANAISDLAAGMRRKIADVTGAALAVSGAFAGNLALAGSAPSLGARIAVPSAGVLPLSGVSGSEVRSVGGNTYHYHIHAEGQLKVPNVRAAATELQRFGEIGALPGAKADD